MNTPMRRFSLSILSAVALAIVAGAAWAQDIRLDMTGGDDQLAERLQGASLLLRETEGEIRTAQDIVAAARADYGRLIGVLYAQGHFAPVIRITVNGQEAGQLSPFAAPARITQVIIDVNPGPVFRLGTADIAPLAPDTDLPEGFRPGAPASTTILRNTTEAAIGAWRDVGNATATVASQRIIAANNAAILNAQINIAPGPRVTFGNLVPEGYDRMRRDRIIEIAGLPTGDIFTPDDLARAEERLRDSGVFNAVTLQETPLNPDGSMDIAATLTEAPLRRIGFGAEISSDEGAGISAYWLHRNLLRGGERLRFDAGISGIGSEGLADIADSGAGIDYNLEGRYSRPATVTPDSTVFFAFALSGVDEPGYEARTVALTFGLDHVFSPRLTGSAAIGLRYSDIDDALGSREVTLFVLPLSLTYDTRDDPLDARAGYYAAATVTPFLDVDGNAGVRGTLDARAYLAFGANDRSRLAGRVQLGSVTGTSVLNLPPDYLFYSGGSGTVRGQEYQSLGATQLGQTSGGQGFLGLSAEFRQDIGDTNFGLVGFVDAGYVSADQLWDDGGTWQSGAGVGLRYTTPFGPIRVDIATPTSGPGQGQDVFLYIGIGQSF